MILIPLKHENMEGRRWPIITFALIGLNILCPRLPRSAFMFSCLPPSIPN
jgi:hypothetical protein